MSLQVVCLTGVSPPPPQILQGDPRGHRGVRRHQRRVFRQREAMAP